MQVVALAKGLGARLGGFTIGTFGPQARQATGAWSRQALRENAASPLFRNAAYLWVNSIVISALGFVFWTVAARLYSAEAVGYGASAIAAIMLISGFAHLGLGFGLVRFLPERGESSVALVNTVFLVTVGAALFAAMVFLLGLDLWSPSLKLIREHPIFYATFVIAAVAFSLSYTVDQVFVARRLAQFVLIRNFGLGVGRIALVMGFAPFFTSFGVVAAHGLAGAALAGLSLFVLLPVAFKNFRPSITWKPRDLRSIFSFSAGNYLATLLLVAPGSIFAIMVLNALGPESAAHFYITWTLGMAISALAVALATSLFAEGSHAPEQVRRQARKAIVGGFLPAVLAAFGVLLLAEWPLRAFGPDYASDGANLLRLLAIASVPYFLINIYLSTARVEKRIWALTLVAGSMSVTSLAVGYALIRPMGLEGVGLAWLAGQASALTLALALLVRTSTFRIPDPSVHSALRIQVEEEGS